MKKITTIVALLALLFLVGCSDSKDDNRTFEIEKNSATVAMGSIGMIEIVSGSGSYAFSYDTPGIAGASVEDIDGNSEVIYIYPQKEGNCKITVRDTGLKLNQIIEVTVVAGGLEPEVRR